MKEHTNLETFLRKILMDRMSAHLYSVWLVVGDGNGHCKLFTQEDREQLRAFLDAHKN